MSDTKDPQDPGADKAPDEGKAKAKAKIATVVLRHPDGGSYPFGAGGQTFAVVDGRLEVPVELRAAAEQAGFRA